MQEKDLKNKLAEPSTDEETFVPPHHSEWKRIGRVFLRRPISLIGLIIVAILVIMAIFAPWIAPYDPLKTNPLNKFAPISSEHWLGTDQLGRDVFSRIVYGARTSLTVGIIAVATGGVIGMAMGLAAAYFGGWVSAIIMRFTDAIMALPGLILILLISGLVGGGIPIVTFALAFGSIPGNCRMMYGQALSIKQRDYVMAARAMGMSSSRVMLTQIFPNAFAPLLVGMTMALGTVVLAEAGLSYLGIGITPPTPSWGVMVNDGQKFLMTDPKLSLIPGAAIMIMVFGFNMAGDGLRDAIDPTLRGIV
ncbi:MAG: ABC transporter permease [Dehalococcoidales bacterium]|nr:ABC transporter permease [Dehalococcoidales bacterium]